MRVAVVGAGGDIGASIVERLRTENHEVVEGTRETCDVTLLASVEKFFREAGEIDALINCHGAKGCIKSSLAVTDREFGEIIHTDLIGTFRTCREAARSMLKRGRGSIVNFSSIHAIATYPERAPYAAAKAGVVGLTKALAIEWASRGVSVNAVLPGQVGETKRTERLTGNARVFERSPSGKLVTFDAVYDAVRYLITARGITGHALVVDDGWTSSAFFGDHAS